MRSRTRELYIVALIACWSLVLGSARAATGSNVELDPPSTAPGYVALLLINEAPFPGERGYVSEADTRSAMLSVLWVLHCRLQVIPPGYTQEQIAAVKARDIIDVMTAGGVKGQVDGFYRGTDGTPQAVPRVHQRVNYLVGIANRGEPGKMARLLVYARDISREYFKIGPPGKDLFQPLRVVGSKAVTGRGYAWMTDVRGFDPGGSFVRVPDDQQGSLGGNRFFTLEKRK